MTVTSIVRKVRSSIRWRRELKRLDRQADGIVLNHFVHRDFDLDEALKQNNRKWMRMLRFKVYREISQPTT